MDRFPTRAGALTQACTSPVGILPNEILSFVFAYATHSATNIKRRYRSPAILSGVCRQWADIVRQTPNLWSFILVLDFASLSMVETRIRRSGRVPLDIIIGERGCDWKSRGIENDTVVHKMFREHLVPASDRWLTFVLEIPSVTPFTRLFPPGLPMLIRLEIKELWTKRVDSQFQFVAPRLRVAHIGSVAYRLRWDPSTFTLANLSTFRLHGAFSVPLSQVLDQLANCSNLVELELRALFSDFPQCEEEVLDLSSRARITLPNLSSMSLDLGTTWCLRVLVSLLDAPKIKSLTLGILGMRKYIYTAPFLEHFPWSRMRPNFPQLESLTLKDRMILLEDETHYILEYLPPVRDLSVVWSPAILGEDVDEALVRMHLEDPSLAKVRERVAQDFLSESWVMVDGWARYGPNENQRVPRDSEGLHFFDS